MKENKPKQKSESFDQGKFVPNVLDKVYAQLGISANQEKVAPEEEARILSLFAKEADAFVPNVLPAVQQQIHVSAAQEQVTAEEEKRIIGLFAQEGSAFVPNILPEVAALEHIGLAQEKVSAHDEKKIISAVAKESKAFVPNDLAVIEQTCGTVKINETQEALELNEKMKNEAGAFLAAGESNVYAKTGLKKAGFFAWLFSKKGIIASSAALTATAAAVVLAVVLSQGGATAVSLTPADGSVTLVNVALTPASAAATTTTSAQAVKALAAASATTTSSNTYTPEASYAVTSKGLATASSFTPKNYSATLAFNNVVNSDVEAPSFSSTLLSNAYSTGYLETKDASKTNVITLRIISSDLNYNNSDVQELYRSKMDAYLTSQKIYAAIEFADAGDINSDLNTFLGNGNSNAVTQQIYEIYDKLISNTHIADYTSYKSGTSSAATAAKTSFATYAKLLRSDSEDFRYRFNGYLTTIVTGAFSDQGRQYILNATDLLYKAYKGQIKVTSPIQDEQALMMYEDAISYVSRSDRYRTDSYYYSSASSANDYVPVSTLPRPDQVNSTNVGSAVQAVRDYLLLEHLSNEEEVIDFIGEAAHEAANQATHGGLPDPYSDHRDPGKHDHGDGPDDPDWGGGGDRGHDHGDWTW
jgi:hypothetical protein